MPPRPLYSRLATLCDAALRCAKTGNDEWRERHTEKVTTLVREHMPSGSGFDNGTVLDSDLSTGEKLVFHTSFHHMDEHGGYDGWTDHTVTVRGSLMHGFTMTISGRDRNDIKEYVHECFDVALREASE